MCLYLDQKLDESYSPSRISIRVGSGAAAAGASAAQADLGGALDAMEVREVDRFEIDEPQGWIICHLRNAPEENPWGGAAGPDKPRSVTDGTIADAPLPRMGAPAGTVMVVLTRACSVMLHVSAVLCAATSCKWWCWRATRMGGTRTFDK